MLVVLLGDDGDVFNSRGPLSPDGGTLAYVVIMLMAGWKEGVNPGFTMVPSMTRNVIYILRLVLGVAMTAASAQWLLRLSRCMLNHPRLLRCHGVIRTCGDPSRMNPPARRWLILYQYLAGLCDASTGLLLIAAPVWTLGLMGLTVIPQPAGVRSLHRRFRAIRRPHPSLGRAGMAAHVYAHIGWSTQWGITALIRTLVVVLSYGDRRRRLESKRITVALSDATFAVIQWIGLRKGWLERAS